MAKAHVYLLPGANVEATDTFASWVDTTNQLVYDMGTVVLTTTQYAQPNTSVGGYTQGNAHVQGILSSNTLVATDGLRGGSTSAYGNLNITSNTIFSESALVHVTANTNNFTVNANNSLFTGNVAINSSKTVLISAANTTINAGPLYVRTNTEMTGGRVDIDSPVLDVTSNTTFTAASFYANVDAINLGVNSSDLMTVNATADFNSSVNIDGLFTVTANATFSGDKVTINSSNTIIGDSTSDRLNITAYLESDLIPASTAVDLGTASNKYGNAHVTYVYAGADVEASGEFRLKGSTAKTLRVSDTAYQDFKLVFDNGTTSNTAVVANTSGLFGGVNQLYSLGSSSVNWKDLYVQNSFITGNEVVTGDVAVNGGDITTSATTFNLLNTNATTVNAFGAATSVSVGAATGTITLNNPTIASSATTVNLLNGTTTTVNAFGAATTVNVGAATGTTNIKNNLNVDGSNISTSAASVNVLNTPSTVSAFANSSTLGIGATSGTLTINNPTVVGTQTTQSLWNTTATTINAFGAATAINIGAATGTANINNATVALNGGTVSTNKTSFTLLNTTATTIDAFGAATTLNVGNSTATQTINLGTGATVNAATKTVNIGTNGVSGSTTNVNVGSSIAGTTTLNSATVVGSAATVNLWNTTSTTVNAFGAATALNLGAADAVITVGKTTGNTSLSVAGNGATGTATITSNVTTGKMAIAPSITSGSVEIGSTNTGAAKVLFTTDADTTATGALVVAGGVGIAKQLRVGNNAVISGDLTVLGAVDFQGNVNVNLAEANTAVLKVATSAIFNGTIGSSLIPGANNTYNIGSSNSRWLDVYANNVTLTSAVSTATVTTSGNTTIGGSANIAGTITTAGLSIANGTKDSIFIDTNVSGTSSYKVTIKTPAAALSANRVLNLADGDTTLQAGTMAITGGTLAQFAATTSSQLAGVISDETGSGSLVFATSPTLVTPTLGVATATSINKVTITAPATSATLTIANGKTATINNTLTFSGTDASSVAFGAGGTVAYTGSTLAQFAATTSSQLAGVISDETGSGVLVFGTSPTFTTNMDSSATFGAFASSTALTLGYTGTAASTLNLSTGAVANATTKTINIGTGGAAGSVTNINFGSSTGTGTATFNNDLVVTGNLTINGTTTTVNSTTIAVDDKNLELGSVAVPTDVTADGGGITLKGATDKTLNWVNATGSWTSSENLELVSGKVYRINGVSVLSANALGSSVTSSSLTSVGTIGNGVWQGTAVGTAYGGTGQTTYTNGQLLIGNSTGGTLTKATLTQGQNITVTNGAGSITIAAANTNLTWTDGTTAGPTINSSTGSGATIPSASATVSGVITTGAQTIAGIKTFANTISGSIDGNATTVTNGVYTIGNQSISGVKTFANTISGSINGTANNATNLNGQSASYYTNASNIASGVLSPIYGGTGVNNSGYTITLGGNINTANTVTTSGNFALTLTTTGSTNITLPTSGTLATTSNKLSAFANTTSAELAAVISDETGSGALVFGTAPTLSNAAIIGGTISGLTSAIGVASGGTGVTTITGIVKGNGASAFTAAVAGTDYQSPITGAASTIASSDLTANRALISNASGKVAVSTVTNTEVGYLSGVTSSIQTQLDAKQTTDTTLTALASYNTNGILTQTANDTFTGRTIASGNGITVTNGDGVSGNPTVSITTSGSTLGQVLTSTGSGTAPSWVSPTNGYQVFTASGTWTKPTDLSPDTMVTVEAWGAGGGGARKGSSGGGGGGGGAYAIARFRLGDLPSTVAVGIGLGGTGGTSNGTNGVAGGNTTFGSLLTAYGGGGGGGTGASTDQIGGGGGGSLGAGLTATVAPNGGRLGGGTATGGAAGGDATTPFGGGAGGGGGSGGTGGWAYAGGGGGGSSSGASGGTSLLAGSGGAGAGSGTVGGAGSAPAGGGAAGNSANGGAGARGEVRIWI